MIEFEDSQSYLRSIVARENELLLYADRTFDHDLGYILTRSTIAILAAPFVRRVVNPAVLEVGGGRGNAISRLLSEYAVDSRSVTMTSLLSLPEHEALIQSGVEVVTPVAIEYLPISWTNKYNIVLTSAVIQWAEIKAAIQGIQRVLMHGGFWIGLDSPATAADVEMFAHARGLSNVSASLPATEGYALNGYSAFAYQKV